MDSKVFQSMRARWNCFSKVDILGSFDFYTLTVSLDHLSPADVERVTFLSLENRSGNIAMDDYERLKKTLPLAAHEFTHYLDGTATLWGMRHLSFLDEAVRVVHTEESEFYKLKTLYDQVRRLRLPNYYTVVEGAPAQRPWRLLMTGGREFNSQGHLSDRPIVFGRFFNKDNDAIVRSPISVVSLLEASAMAEELEIRIRAAHHLGDERLVEERLIAEKTVHEIYDASLTEYSVCAHLVANSTGCSDIGASLRIAGFVSRYVLNVSDGDFESAKSNLNRWARLVAPDISSQQFTLMRHALKNRNYGSLFYLIAAALPRNPEGEPAKFYQGFEYSLGILGLKFSQTLANAERLLKAQARKLEKSPLMCLREIGEAAVANFLLMRTMIFSRDFLKLHLPPVVLNDMSYHQFRKEENLLANFDLDGSFDALCELQIRAENLAEACL